MTQFDTTTRARHGVSTGASSTGPVTEASITFGSQESEPTYADFIGEPATLASPRLSERAQAS
ncbi:hypothetical protein AS850_14790 [Frondihabitans sp. 762G35]|uniref:hypothetical protein n=1 Tax=Frondihabitans sp. 762G35 TaxID=1446794 RepID=UPI000D224124|nr:hypothetical protein [Frondihabitans sp. 762G35]ARC58350.1 hypothetical protein AS850_14790 [Frondihabitans sp. 762G35]